MHRDGHRTETEVQGQQRVQALSPVPPLLSYLREAKESEPGFKVDTKLRYLLVSTTRHDTLSRPFNRCDAKITWKSS